ncbi:MAG: 2-hydroxyacyl-CoA dehydratase [Candidatus Omnitrophica bacterium]|nr:2-hydroxyacyl-CoA dehydratase [Candidatus Omnitrophota bacterium]
MAKTTKTEHSGNAVVYSSPYIPAEWVAAHGFVPSRRSCMNYNRTLFISPPINVEAGVCPYMRGFINQAAGDPGVRAIILTTTCDQMRRGADLINLWTKIPCFLMHVPSSWQTAGVKKLYASELERLGHFLVSLGGIKPCTDDLAAIMLGYEGKREKLLAQQGALSGKSFAEKLACFAETGEVSEGRRQDRRAHKAIPLGFIGSPLTGNHFDLFDVFAAYGADIVVNATETGERVLPARFDVQRLKDEPAQVLAQSYFGAFPDISDRPNDKIFKWMKKKVEDNGIRGIVSIRYVWCDKWHAEVERFRKCLPVPLLDIELNGEEIGARAKNRIQAFMEGLL